MNESGKWRVHFGTHRGTIGTRYDSNFSFDSKGEAVKFYDSLSATEKDEVGNWLWFASLISPAGKEIKYKNGAPYLR